MSAIVGGSGGAATENKRETITLEQWEDRKSKIFPSREIMNKLVMNFLIVEGYKQGALKFEKESGIKAEMDEELIDQRIEIRKLIEKGSIEEAINRINSLNPEILDSNQELYFELKRQQLVELIKANQIEDAISFAQNNLSGTCKGNDQKSQHFQDELEKTMTLLMYEDLSKSPMRDLADITSRQKLASQVNQAILKAQGYSSELKLGFYWQLMQYSQNQLVKEGNMDFPVLRDPLGDVEMSNGGNENANDKQYKI